MIYNKHGVELYNIFRPLLNIFNKKISDPRYFVRGLRFP